MKFSFSSSKKAPSLLKPKISLKFDPHRYWVMLLSAFVLLFAAALIYFSLAFRRTLSTIDAPATPLLQTNAPKIDAMNRSLDATSAALELRKGVPAAAPSQTEPSVVE